MSEEDESTTSIKPDEAAAAAAAAACRADCKECQRTSQAARQPQKLCGGVQCCCRLPSTGDEEIDDMIYAGLHILALALTLGIGPFLLLIGLVFFPAIYRTDEAFETLGILVHAKIVKEEETNLPNCNVVWRTYQISTTVETAAGEIQERVYERKELSDPAVDGAVGQSTIINRGVDCVYLPELGMASARLPRDSKVKCKYGAKYIMFGLAFWFVGGSILFHLLAFLFINTWLGEKDALLVLLSFGFPFLSGAVFFVTTGNGQRIWKNQLPQNQLWRPVCPQHANNSV